MPTGEKETSSRQFIAGSLAGIVIIIKNDIHVNINKHLSLYL
jgi:hypothetical protein